MILSFPRVIKIRQKVGKITIPVWNHVADPFRIVSLPHPVRLVTAGCPLKKKKKNNAPRGRRRQSGRSRSLGRNDGPSHVHVPRGSATFWYIFWQLITGRGDCHRWKVRVPINQKP
jgi:hypothetical protein